MVEISNRTIRVEPQSWNRSGLEKVFSIATTSWSIILAVRAVHLTSGTKPHGANKRLAAEMQKPCSKLDRTRSTNLSKNGLTASSFKKSIQSSVNIFTASFQRISLISSENSYFITI